MAGEITAHYRWTLPELMRAFRWHRRGGVRGSVRRVVETVLFVVVAAYGALEYAAYGWSRRMFEPFAIGLYLFLLFALVRWLVPWRVKRNFAKSAGRDSEVDWTLGEDGLRLRTDHSAAELTWGAFTKAVQTPEGLLLYPQPQLFHWLPVEAFPNRVNYEEAVALVRRHVAEFKQIEG